MKPEKHSLSNRDVYRNVSSSVPRGSAMEQRPLILLVDDDPDDVDLFSEALGHITCEVALTHAPNGKEALRYLYLHQFLPCLIVMDLNMPVMDGKEAIREILKERKFQTIPIVVLTTSSSQQDQQFCDEHRLAYFTKPSNSGDLTRIVGELVDVCLQR